jgi:hypothetical protein
MAKEIKIPIDNTSIRQLIANLNEMKAALQNATDPKQIEEINADIAQTNELITEQAKAFDASGKSIRELKSEFKALAGAAAEATDPESLQVFANAAGQAKDRIADINEEIAIFAGDTKFEQAGTALGQMKTALTGLNFQKASEKAKQLSDLAKGISFKSATAGLKDLGTTFVNLGKTLLTNPLFLLAAVIAGIVFVIYKLLDATGVLKVAMKAIGDVFKAVGDIVNDFLIQPLKDLTDWFGITANAAEESAERQAKAEQKAAFKSQLISDNYITALENEIKVKKANGEDTAAIELELIYVKRDSVAAQLAEERKKLKETKDLTEEQRQDQLKLINDLRNTYKSLGADATAFRQNTKNAREAEDKKELEDAEKKAKELRDKGKAAAELNLQVKRKLKDIELSLLEEGQAKEESILNESYKRQSEDIQRNEKYTAEQKESLTTALETQRLAELTKINDKFREEELKKERDKLIKQQEQFNNLLLTIESLENKYLDSKLSKETQETNAVRDKYFDIIEAAKKAGEDIKLLEEAQAAEIADIQDKYRKEKIEKDKEAAEFEMQLNQDVAKAKIDVASGVSDFLNSLNSKNKAILLAALAIEKASAIANVIISAQQEIAGHAATAAANPANAVTFGAAGLKQLAALTALTKVRAGLSIATIAATGFNSAKGIVTGGSSTAPATPVNQSGTPNVQLFGQPNQGNELSLVNQGNNLTNNIQVNASVSVDEITSVQKKVAKISELASI